MPKIMINLPDDLLRKIRTHIPIGLRSKLMAQLIEKEIEKREQELEEFARELEASPDSIIKG